MTDVCMVCYNEKYIVLPTRLVELTRQINTIGDVLVDEAYEVVIGGIDACPRCSFVAEADYAGRL